MGDSFQETNHFYSTRWATRNQHLPPVRQDFSFYDLDINHDRVTTNAPYLVVAHGSVFCFAITFVLVDGPGPHIEFRPNDPDVSALITPVRKSRGNVRAQDGFSVDLQFPR